MTKAFGKKSTPRYKKIVVLGQLECVSAKLALDFISGELTKIPAVSGSLDFGLDQKMKRCVIYERLRSQLIEYVQHRFPNEELHNFKGANDVADLGSDQDWFISLESFKAFASSVGVEFVLEFHKKIPLPELEPVTSGAPLVKEDLANYSLPKKVIKNQERVKRPLDINHELYILRKLQHSLASRTKEDAWDESEYENEIKQARRTIRKRIRRLLEHIPGNVPSKPISRLAVRIGWKAYLETNQPPEATDVLQRMHKLAKRDTGHECLLEATVTSSGRETVKYQSGKKRPTYKDQACYRTLKDWWDSYTKI